MAEAEASVDSFKKSRLQAPNVKIRVYSNQNFYTLR